MVVHSERCAASVFGYTADMAHEAVCKRRLRYERTSTGKRVELTERDIVWFQKLHQHGPLPSSFLVAFTENLRRNGTRSLERLGDLFHEHNTPHGGPYLDRPRQQWSAISKFERTVYSNTPQAEQVLIERGRIRPAKPPPAAHYHHGLMVACITAAIELATTLDPALRFISEEEILERSPHKTLAIPCRISHTNPRTGRTQTLDAPLIPDALFGIEYTVGSQKLYRFFMVEADRAHEPVRRANLNETSYLRKVLQYREVVGNRGYQRHFGMKSSMLVLSVTTNTQHMLNILGMIEETAGQAGMPYMLFRTAHEFGDRLRVPDPSFELLTDPWQRARCPGLRIDRPSEGGYFFPTK